MPIVKIDVQSGKSTAYKRALLHGVREALVEALGIATESITQRIIETPAENIDAPEARSDQLTIINVTMIAGRGPGMKSEMYRRLAQRLGENPGIHSSDLIVLVSDPQAECFYLNGKAMCDVGVSEPAS